MGIRNEIKDELREQITREVIANIVKKYKLVPHKDITSTHRYKDSDRACTMVQIIFEEEE